MGNEQAYQNAIREISSLVDSAIIHQPFGDERLLQALADGFRKVLADKKDQGAIAMDASGTLREYFVFKTDGSKDEPDAEYLVLRLDNDMAAVDAALTYARSIERTNHEMSVAIEDKAYHYYRLEDYRKEVERKKRVEE